MRDIAGAYDPAARQEKILGAPQRIPPLPPAQLTDDAMELTAIINAAAGLAPDPFTCPWTATMMHHPVLFRAHSMLAVLLMAGGTLPARDRELAILRTGWLCGAPFEWSGHVELAKRVAGISAEHIEMVTIGAAAPGWSGHDAAVLRAVEELLGNAMISDGTWAILSKTYREPQFLELPLLIGQYLGVAFLQNSLRVPPSEGYAGLSAR